MSHTNLVVPEVVDGTVYRWTFGGSADGSVGETTFEVDAAAGARITRFSLDAQNILTGREVNDLNYGSTFWTSPQSQWGWPPPVELDSEPYTAHRAGENGSVGVFSGRADSKLGLAATKTIFVDGARGVVTIEYALRNLSGEPRTVAPWEISRHPPHGLTFFPVGDAIEPASTLAVTREAGAIWFAYDPRSITDHQKLFAHGTEGWICHVDVARRLQLVKAFPEIARADQAPGEASLEIYADPTHTYIEVEQQGAYRALGPDESVSWQVRWMLRSLPAATTLRSGNVALLTSARTHAST
jgi:hypothetical protein